MDRYTYEQRVDVMNKRITAQAASISALTETSTELVALMQNVGACPCVRCTEEREGASTEVRDGSGVILTKHEDGAVEVVQSGEVSWEDDFRTVQLMDRVNNQSDLLVHKDVKAAAMRRQYRMLINITRVTILLCVIACVLLVLS